MEWNSGSSEWRVMGIGLIGREGNTFDGILDGDETGCGIVERLDLRFLTMCVCVCV